MAKLVNRAKMTTLTVGTGTMVLLSSIASYQSFTEAGVVDGDVVRYVIEDGTAWEIGIGTFTTLGLTLTRTVTESSNAGAAITLSGSATVYVTATSKDFVEELWAMPSATYTLTSTTAVQKLLNIGTNGALRVTPGIYRYNLGFTLTSMSTTSGNCAFNLLGAGTATISAYRGFTSGKEDTQGVATLSGQSFTAATTANPMVTAGTNANIGATILGTFRVTAAGTIIPSVQLNTAAAAVVSANSFIYLQKISQVSTDTSYGDWG